jgi:hypothetical protein
LASVVALHDWLGPALQEQRDFLEVPCRCAR